jgi:hypothetical protein
VATVPVQKVLPLSVTTTLPFGSGVGPGLAVPGATTDTE